MSKIKRFFLKLILAILGIAIVAGAVYTVKGYKLYKNALIEISLEDTVEELRSRQSYTKLDELPQIYLDAVVSVEDHRFYSHPGVDIIAIGRALWNDLKARAFIEGGSTITQQLAKNLYFSQEKKLERKVAEMFMAFEIEDEYEKDEILELYVNCIYYGSGYYNIRDAAMGYFHKEPSKLNDYESTLLAGLPNAPSAYSPDANTDLAEKRQKRVLESMVENNKLTKEEAEKILSSKYE